MNSTILLPSTIDVQTILNTFGRITGERLLLMLSYIYTTGHWKYDIKNARFDISKEVLAKLGGDKTLKKSSHIEDMEVSKVNSKKQYLALLQWAQAKGIITRGDGYEVGKSSKEVRFCDYDTIFKNRQEYTLTSKNAIKAFHSLKKELEEDFYNSNFEGRQQVYLKIYKSVKGLQYDREAAYAFIRKNDDTNAMIYHYYIKNGFDVWKIDPQGRVYTMPVVIPRRLRKFLSYDGKPLYQFDVSHCQPLLHSLLYKHCGFEDTEECKKYTVLCEQGLLYEYLNNSMSCPANIEDEAVRSAFKKRVFQDVFYGHPESVATFTSELNKVMKREFPILHKIMTEIKTPNHRVLPIAMQAIEADIMMDGVVRELEGETFPIITIHDAILTTAEGIVKVDAAIKKAFSDLNLTPSIKNTQI